MQATLHKASFEGGAGPAIALLQETLVGDLHWSLMQVATLALALETAARDPERFPLRPWRHLLADDGKTMILALRYSAQLQIDPATAGRVESFVKRIVTEKLQLKEIFARANQPRPALAETARRWRALAADAKAVLAAMQKITARLQAEFGEDSRTIDSFLAAAAAGAPPGATAESPFAIPKLVQRRRSPRIRVDVAAKVAFGGAAYAARLFDVSREGLGFDCKCDAEIGAQVEIELPAGRRLTARIARKQGDRFGATFLQPLGLSDSLLQQTAG